MKGHAGNDRDGIYKGVKDEKQRDAITVAFTPMKGSKAGELAARFEREHDDKDGETG